MDRAGGARALERERVLPNATTGRAVTLRQGEPLRVYHPRAAPGGKGFPETLMHGAHSAWYRFAASPATAQAGVAVRPARNAGSRCRGAPASTQACRL